MAKIFWDRCQISISFSFVLFHGFFCPTLFDNYSYVPITSQYRFACVNDCEAHNVKKMQANE